MELWRWTSARWYYIKRKFVFGSNKIFSVYWFKVWGSFFNICWIVYYHDLRHPYRCIFLLCHVGYDPISKCVCSLHNRAYSLVAYYFLALYYGLPRLKSAAQGCSYVQAYWDTLKLFDARPNIPSSDHASWYSLWGDYQLNAQISLFIKYYNPLHVSSII